MCGNNEHTNYSNTLQRNPDPKKNVFDTSANYTWSIDEHYLQ